MEENNKTIEHHVKFLKENFSNGVSLDDLIKLCRDYYEIANIYVGTKSAELVNENIKICGIYYDLIYLAKLINIDFVSYKSFEGQEEYLTDKLMDFTKKNNYKMDTSLFN